MIIKSKYQIKILNQFNNFYLPNREGSVSFPSIHLSLRNRVPTKIQLPVEATIGHVRACHIFKGVITDYINDGTHYCPPRKRKEAKLLDFKLVKSINQKGKDVFFFLNIVFNTYSWNFYNTIFLITLFNKLLTGNLLKFCPINCKSDTILAMADFFKNHICIIISNKCSSLCKQK